MTAEFKLRNEYNQDYNLSASKTALMVSPSGLGYSMDADYTRIGYGWVQDSLTDTQASMSGNVYLQGDDPFKLFADLTKFIRTAKKLKLVYSNTQGEYLRDIDIKGITNNGLAGVHTLKCTLSMTAKSLWYLNDSTNYAISSVATDAMRYAYTWPKRFRASINGELNIINDGSVEAPFTVSFTGPVVNPTLTLLKDNAEIAKVNIIGEAVEGESLEFSTVDGDLYLYHHTASEDINLTDKLDISNDNFFKIPVGTYVLKLTSDGEITKPVLFNIHKLYRAV